MVAAVAVWFGIGDVVFFLDDGAPVGITQKIDAAVDVVDEVADHANANRVATFAQGRLGGCWVAFALAFFSHAVVGLNSTNQVLIQLGMTVGNLGAA